VNYKDGTNKVGIMHHQYTPCIGKTSVKVICYITLQPKEKEPRMEDGKSWLETLPACKT